MDFFPLSCNDLEKDFLNEATFTVESFHMLSDIETFLMEVQCPELQ